MCILRRIICCRNETILCEALTVWLCFFLVGRHGWPTGRVRASMCSLPSLLYFTLNILGIEFLKLVFFFASTATLAPSRSMFMLFLKSIFSNLRVSPWHWVSILFITHVAAIFTISCVSERTSQRFVTNQYHIMRRASRRKEYLHRFAHSFFFFNLHSIR